MSKRVDEYDKSNTWEHLDRFDNSHECESEELVDKTWSIKHEGHLNRHNIIFKEKLLKIVQGLQKQNNSLGRYTLREGKWIKR